MKLKVNNLGPIKEGEIELGGLTVLCGDNNTGKTYLAYTVFGYYYYFSKINPVKKPTRGSHHLITNELAQKLFKSGKGTVKINLEKLAEESASFFDLHFNEFRDELHTIFASLRQELNGAEITSSPKSIITLIVNRLERISNISLLKGVQAKFADGELKFEVNIQERLEFYSKNVAVARMYLAANLDRYLLRPPMHRPFILTSERSGISLFYKDLDSSRNALVDALQNLDAKKFRKTHRPIDVNNYSKYAKPISEEINFVRDLEEISRHTSPLYKETNQELHEKIEQIIGGRVMTNGPSLRFQSRTGSPDKFDIPLHMASSSTRELANLYFYLKHIAKKHDLLILDEPESHLSREGQRKLANLLCTCVAHGVKVLVTTHSEIILKEISNMIMIGHCKVKNKAFDGNSQFYSNVKGLKKHNVKAYECIGNKVKQVEVSQQGIELKRFDEVAVALDKDRQHLLELLCS